MKEINFDDFNYTIKDKTINWNKLDYIDYNSFDYFAKKFPYYNSIPGFDKVIQEFANNSTSPLNEMLTRINTSIDIQNNENLDNEASQSEWVDFKLFDSIFTKNI